MKKEEKEDPGLSTRAGGSEYLFRLASETGRVPWICCVRPMLIIWLHGTDRCNTSAGKGVDEFFKSESQRIRSSASEATFAWFAIVNHTRFLEDWVSEATLARSVDLHCWIRNPTIGTFMNSPYYGTDGVPASLVFSFHLAIMHVSNDDFTSGLAPVALSRRTLQVPRKMAHFCLVGFAASAYFPNSS